MTPEERAEAIRQHGYREPIGDWHVAMVITTVTLSLGGFGAFGLLFGPDAGYRLRGGLALAVAIGPAIWGWNFLKRPVAPRDDADFERELRYRRGDADRGPS
jgi:hypothetical protein